jgi:release factor glutamine methyltransferase
MTCGRAPVAALSVRELVAGATRTLGSAPEARWVVAHALGVEAGALVGRLDDTVPAPAAAAVEDMIRRRRGGEPLQYVLGSWAFRTLELQVDERVLIPRPETEQLVEEALAELSHQAANTVPGTELVAVDLGTGSGAVALSLAVEAHTGPGDAALEVWATDASPGALAVCRANLDALARTRPEAAARVRLAEGSWFGALPERLSGRVRLVISNPPYVSQADWADLDPEVRDHEPAAALVPGATGLEALEAIVDEAWRWLAPGGSLVVELAPGQAARVMRRVDALGYAAPSVRRDLAGRSRMLVARWPG